MPEPLLTVDRYALHEELGSGGMAVVHLGRLAGSVGFSRVVAIKRLHRHLASDPDFVEMFIDEARLASRIRHPNVVPTLDVVASDDELLLVLEYIPSLSLAEVLQLEEPLPIALAARIFSDALSGLQAAHDAADEDANPLHIVHRDVSPHNLLVGADGTTRVADFGVATANVKLHTTRGGQLRGKLRYAAPEQLMGERVDARADLYSTALSLWQTLAGEHPLKAESEGELVLEAVQAEIPALAALRDDLPAGLSELVARALDREPSKRPQTAADFATLLERCAPPAPPRELSRWLALHAQGRLADRAAAVQRVEKQSSEKAPSEHAAATEKELTPTAEMPVTSSPASMRRRRGGFGPYLITGIGLALGGFGWMLLLGDAEPDTESDTPSPAAAPSTAPPNTSASQGANRQPDAAPAAASAAPATSASAAPPQAPPRPHPLPQQSQPPAPKPAPTPTPAPTPGPVPDDLLGQD